MSNSAMVDQKGRLKIPATLLPALKGSSTEFFITSEGGSSVRIYPRLVWNQVEERLEHLCAHNGNNQKLLVRAKYFGQGVAIEPCPIPERSETQSNYGADEKMLSKLSSAPRFPRTIRRNKEERHVQGTEMRFRIQRRVRPDSRGQASQALTRPPHLGHKTKHANPNSLPAARTENGLSECVCAVTGFVGQGRKHP
jgi:hypothetical protein